MDSGIFDGDGVDTVDRAHWKNLAEERVNDAKILLDNQQWAAAYYLAGSAVECGLKACVLAYVEAHADVLYREKRYSEKCWTHNIDNLVEAAGLGAARFADTAANQALSDSWGIAAQWDETSRYQFKTESEARGLYDAVTDNANGVLPWIKAHW